MRGLQNYNIASFESTNELSIPEIFAVKEKINIEEWYDFDTARRKNNNNGGLHFYISDYKFECIWTYPQRYIKMFQRYDVLIQPDFSLYYDYPVALQIYNKYRNHWLAAYYAVNGVNVIPNISVSTVDCWDWSFLGYPCNSVVSFSDLGAIRDKSSRQITYAAYDEMIKRLEPKQIIYFTRSGNSPSEADVVQLPFKK